MTGSAQAGATVVTVMSTGVWGLGCDLAVPRALTSSACHERVSSRPWPQRRWPSPAAAEARRRPARGRAMSPGFIPAGSPVYFELSTDVGGTQWTQALALAKRFPGLRQAGHEGHRSNWPTRRSTSRGRSSRCSGRQPPSACSTSRGLRTTPPTRLSSGRSIWPTAKRPTSSSSSRPARTRPRRSASTTESTCTATRTPRSRSWTARSSSATPPRAGQPRDRRPPRRQVTDHGRLGKARHGLRRTPGRGACPGVCRPRRRREARRHRRWEYRERRWRGHRGTAQEAAASELTLRSDCRSRPKRTAYGSRRSVWASTQMAGATEPFTPKLVDKVPADAIAYVGFKNAYSLGAQTHQADRRAGPPGQEGALAGLARAPPARDQPRRRQGAHEPRARAGRDEGRQAPGRRRWRSRSPIRRKPAPRSTPSARRRPHCSRRAAPRSRAFTKVELANGVSGWQSAITPGRASSTASTATSRSSERFPEAVKAGAGAGRPSSPTIRRTRRPPVRCRPRSTGSSGSTARNS